MTDQPQPPKDDGQLHQKTRNYGKVPHWIMHDLRLTDGAVRLYAHMHWRYGSNHKNFEGQRSVAQMLGVSERTIGNRIRELEAAGWVVVVERDYDEKSGKYRTPFYHVFETRKAAYIFRTTYKKAEGENIRPRPKLAETEHRKPRTGKGGKPSHKPKEVTPVTPVIETAPATTGTQVPTVTSGTQVPTVTSGTQVPTYSGTQVPTIQEQVYPRTKEEKDSPAPKNGTEIAPVTQTLTVLPKTRANPMYDAIKAIWRYTAGLNKDMEKMLTGTATKKGWKEYNIVPAMTSDEVSAWAAWYRKTELHGDPNMSMLAVRSGVQSSVYYWRELKAEEDRKRAEQAQQQSELEPDEWRIDQFVRKSKPKEDANASEPAA